MDKNFSTAAQARTRNAEPSLNQHANELHPLHRLWLRRKLRKLYRNLTGRVRDDFSLDNNERGRAVLMVLLALGLSHYEADMIAPWALLELTAIIEASAQFNPTPENIGKAIGLTNEERKQHEAWAFWPCNKTIEEVRRDAANTRTEKRRKQRAEQTALAMSRPPRQVAVYAAVKRLSHRSGCSLPINVSDIVDSIRKKQPSVWRCHFPLNGDDTQRMIRRDLDRLERNGLVETRRGKRGVRYVSLIENGCAKAVLPAAVSRSALKPWQTEGISRATWYRRRHETEPDSRTTVVSPDFQPETLDLSMFPACGRRETAVVGRKDEVPCGQAINTTTKKAIGRKATNTRTVA